MKWLNNFGYSQILTSVLSFRLYHPSRLTVLKKKKSITFSSCICGLTVVSNELPPSGLCLLWWLQSYIIFEYNSVEKCGFTYSRKGEVTVNKLIANHFGNHLKRDWQCAVRLSQVQTVLCLKCYHQVFQCLVSVLLLKKLYYKVTH